MIAKKSYRLFFITASVLSIFLFSAVFLSNPEYRALPKSWIDKITHGKKPEEDSEFNELKWGWQFNMPWYDNPTFDKALVHAPAVNWRGPGHETYATLYASRDAAMTDPYFMAVQQIIYRVLWRRESRTQRHTMTVFVLPFVSQEQRDMFTAAGALVREVPEEHVAPGTSGVPGRWRDMFSKLDMWNHTEFSRITYLDSDAFPLHNIDSIFEESTMQRCRKELLPEADVPHVDEICDYTFAGWVDGRNTLNAGVMTFSPNKMMYDRLMREVQNETHHNNGEMEQALINWAYRPEGPFPMQLFSHKYNGGTDTLENGEEEWVIHAKLWNTQWEPEDKWYKHTFNHTWAEMLKFYKSPDFKTLRLDVDPYDQ